MHKILIISPHFPTPDIYDDLSKDPRSKFLLNYAEEFVNIGYSVTVIHSVQRYPFYINAIINCLSIISPKFLKFKQNPEVVLKNTYASSGVNIIRKPINKYIPHSRISNREVRKFAGIIRDELNCSFQDFNLILLDYLSPSLDMADFLGAELNQRVNVIFHQTDESYLKKNLEFYRTRLMKCDGVIYRNQSARDKITSKYRVKNVSHLMYSGIPNSQEFGLPRHKVRKLLFVGRILESKRIHDVILALNKLPKIIKDNIKFEIVGDGEYKPVLKDLVTKLNLTENVKFTSKIPHTEVFEKMQQCDAFVMVSKETFGMVYVEALSQGCIVIAAKNEGIDGVVNDGQNGFLTSIGDVNNLSKILTKLYLMNSSDVTNLSFNGIETAKKMQNKTLAKDFIDNLVESRE
ncbi:glycosyltransferase [Photobacterium sanguinicancri]|uniref:glycosyltransferase n=1 Tax=Photobacterium sanguinicancri TaxID=875932 RepID=UPI003D127F8C